VIDLACNLMGRKHFVRHIETVKNFETGVVRRPPPTLKEHFAKRSIKIGQVVFKCITITHTHTHIQSIFSIIDMHKINFIIYVNNDLDMYIIYVYILQKKTYYKNNKKPTTRYFYAKHNYFIPWFSINSDNNDTLDITK